MLGRKVNLILQFLTWTLIATVAVMSIIGWPGPWSKPSQVNVEELRRQIYEHVYSISPLVETLPATGIGISKIQKIDGKWEVIR